MALPKETAKARPQPIAGARDEAMFNRVAVNKAMRVVPEQDDGEG